jgi:hypothetical protein
VPQLAQDLLSESAKARFREFNLTLPSIVATGRPVNLAQFFTQVGLGTSGSPVTVAPIGTAPTRYGVPRVPLGARLTTTPQSVPPALIMAASNDQADVEFQAEVSNELTLFIDGTSQAIVNAHNLWRQKAFLSGVQVRGMTANGGSVQGPSLSPWIKAHPMPSTLYGSALRISQAAADGLESSWRDWQDSVRVPGLAWWPAFVAYPGPVTPPMPNVPTRLAALDWDARSVSPDSVAAAMKARLGAPVGFSNQLFASIAAGFSAAVQAWFGLQMVMNVLGRGTVPNFAPPYVPVGTVAFGDIIEQGPHFFP